MTHRPPDSPLPMALLLGLLLPWGAGAQFSGPVLVDHRPHDAVVAVAIHFPSGSALDPDGLEGTAFLLGRILIEEANLQLAPLSAVLDSEVTRSGTLFRLRAPAGSWGEAWDVVQALLSTSSLSQGTFQRVQQDQRERLIFQVGAPVRAFQLERDQLFLGAGDPGARPLRGSPEGLARITLADITRFREQHLSFSEATVVVVGAASATQVQGSLRAPTRGMAPQAGPREPQEEEPEPAGKVGDPEVEEERPVEGEPLPDVEPVRASPAPLPAPAPPPLLPPANPDGPPAWTSGERRLVDQEITSTWIAMGWPLPAGTPPLLMDFLAHLISESLNTQPPDPGLYHAEVRVELVRDAPVLVVDASVDPQATARWEERIRSAFLALQDEPPQGAFFELTRRRFRAGIVMEQAAADMRAHRLVSRAVRGGEPQSSSREVWGLTREGVRALAQAAGELRILLYGPARMMGSSASPGPTP